MSDIPLLLMLLLAIAVLLRLDFVFYLVYLGAGTYALAHWWTERSLSRLQIVRRYTNRAFLGQTVPVRISIKNQGWWPVLWLRFDETTPINLATAANPRHVLSLRPKERLEIAYELVGRQRGYYLLGPALLTTGDLFGFAEARGRAVETDHLIVYPRVIPLSKLDLPSRSPYGTVRSRQRIFADPTRIGGKRDYQPGDPWRDVDWKSSAHAGTLQVKKYDPAVSLDSVIYLNLNSQEYSRPLRYQASEWAIIVAASLANYLATTRQAVGLGSNGIDSLSGAQHWTIPPRAGRLHLMKLLEWLARVQIAEAPPFAHWLPTAVVRLTWGTTVIVVNPAGDEAICQALHRLVRSGLNPVLVAVEPHGQFAAVRQRARRLGFSAQLVADEDDLRRWSS